ncbi:hypothetical protein SH668x_000951 [Planctomicrobium sp. SH668]|uniref:hypothetical protein n=1 Tax=Planctomicrobium sp. SH668 TaxID=3448126 RepID=UPI003F5AF743
MSTDQPRPDEESESASTPTEIIPGSTREQPRTEPQITFGTVISFLLGNRDAILRVANSQSATWLGISFTILAALFRDYDQADLLQEPYWLIVPLLASTLLTTVMYGFLKLIPKLRRSGQPASSELGQLLNCVWMMAPTAVIYAFPAERFMSSVDSTKLNIGFLAFVATWRVALMIRVVVVLFRISLPNAISTVLFVSVTIAFFAMLAVPIPLLQIMGGVLLSPESEIINQARVAVVVTCFYSWAVFAIAYVVNIFWHDSSSKKNEFDAPGNLSNRVSSVTWIATAVGFVLMFVACIFTQPEFQRATRFRLLLQRGETHQALDFASKHNRRDFPIQWDPPPRIERFEKSPPLPTVLAQINHEPQTPAWITDIYGKKLIQQHGSGIQQSEFWYELSGDELEIVVTFFELHPQYQQQLNINMNGPFSYWIHHVVSRISESMKTEGRWGRSKEVISIELLARLISLFDVEQMESAATRSEVRDLRDQIHNLIENREQTEAVNPGVGPAEVEERPEPIDDKAN